MESVFPFLWYTCSLSFWDLCGCKIFMLYKNFSCCKIFHFWEWNKECPSLWNQATDEHWDSRQENHFLWSSKIIQLIWNKPLGKIVKGFRNFIPQLECLFFKKRNGWKIYKLLIKNLFLKNSGPDLNSVLKKDSWTNCLLYGDKEAEKSSLMTVTKEARFPIFKVTWKRSVKCSGI